MTANLGSFSPIALFAYRRPAHLRQTLQALRTNPEASQTELFIFCDAAKDASVIGDVDAVRKWFKATLDLRLPTSFSAIRITASHGILQKAFPRF